MLKLYSGNKMETLVAKLHEKILRSGAHPLQTTQIIVQNRGMQHWLNMQMADAVPGGVCMNIKYSLVASYLWQIIRLCVPDAPRTNPFSRELLVWNIYDTLGEDQILNHPLMQEPSDYWFNSHNTAAQQSLKRFQLAQAQADLFEQYWMYRPDWIESWEKETADHWQALLWNNLDANSIYNPIKLIKKAQAELRQIRHKLPKEVYIFGINSMPPLYVDFLFELSKQQNITLFLLNPSEEYWFDLISEKELARKKGQHLRKKAEAEPEAESTTLNVTDSLFSALPFETGNPILAALGRQSQEFFEILYNNASLQDEQVYQRPDRTTVLHRLQNDLFHLTDARQQTDAAVDDSISITSAHSHLREIQALHDWLLAKLDADSTLNPQDIIIMCPQIEAYAPYIQSVFNPTSLPFNPQQPKLPCSIADRKESDSNPLIQAYLNLLKLPDSRFQISEILGYLRLNAIQNKFNINDEDLQLYEVWLSDAAVHWGLNGEHKSRLLATEMTREHPPENIEQWATTQFTWQQGLERLLRGFAYGDDKALVGNQIYLPWVEGDNAIKLGNLIRLIEQLSQSSVYHRTERTAQQWQLWLTELFDNYFTPENDELIAAETIQEAIGKLAENTLQAGYGDKIPLEIVSYFLEHQFSQPEQGRQFMTGQITFCSMLPMRSIPFRIIGVLGMNDGEFPRQRPPYGFDLLAQSPRRKGDRSRRDEDRCLFLEALVSARDALYLSYQGNDAKNNTEKQPSLVLAELSHYLQKGYWHSSKENEVMLSGVLRKLPLQPFNEKNYQPPFSSYDGKWLTLGQDAKQVSDTSTETMLPDISNSLNEAIDIADLVTFFNNPPKGFARKRLGLYLDDDSGALAADSEPFTTNNLDRYKTQSHYISHELKQARTPANVTIAATNDALETDEVTRLSLLAGHLPATPTMAIQLEEWREQALQFTAQLQEIGAGTVMDTRVQTTSGESVIHARLPLLTFTGTALATKTATEGESLSNSVLLFWRLADIKGKDIVNLWLHHLMANITRGPTHTIGVFRAKGNQPSLQGFAPVQDAASELQKWLHYWHKGLTQPCFVNADLAKEILTNEKFSASHYANYWQADFQQQGLIYDPYYAYFWQVPPVYDEHLIGYAESLYGMAMSSLESWSAEEVKNILTNIRVPQSDAINTAAQRESHA